MSPHKLRYDDNFFTIPGRYHDMLKILLWYVDPVINNITKGEIVMERWSALIAIIIVSVQVGSSQLVFNGNNDHVFTTQGNAKITLASGIPYIGIAEYAYGVTDRFTAGVLAGLTPRVEGYGVRLRTIILQNDRSFRSYFCVPVVYYPKTKDLGGDPWWLTRPNINFEWIMESGFRYKVGGSIIAAGSHNSFFGDKAKAKFQPDYWNAVHCGTSFPVGGGIMFQAELSAVMNGLTMAGKDWVGGPPAILIIGISREV